MAEKPSGGRSHKWDWLRMLIWFICTTVIPVCVANFVPGGDVIMTYVVIYGVASIIALFVSLGIYNRHSSVGDGEEDADEYVTRKGVEMTVVTDEYRYTDEWRP